MTVNFKLWILLALLFAGNVQAQPKNELRIGFMKSIFADVNSRDVAAAIEIYLREYVRILNQDMDVKYTGKVVLFEDKKELIKLLKSNQLDFFSISTLIYLDLKDLQLIEPVFFSALDENVGEDYYILVHKDSGIENLADLKDGQMLLPAGYKSDVISMWVDTELLKSQQERSDKFFSKVKSVSNASKAVLPVFFKQADAAICCSHAYQTMSALNPQLKTSLKILKKSDVFAYGITCVRKHMENDLKAAIIETSQKVNENPSGKQILLLFKQSTIVRYDDKYIQSTIDLREQYQTLMQAMKN